MAYVCLCVCKLASKNCFLLLENYGFSGSSENLTSTVFILTGLLVTAMMTTTTTSSAAAATVESELIATS